MPTPNGCDSASASSREVDNFLDFGDGLGLDVQFGGGVEGTCPCRLGKVPDGVNSDVVFLEVELCFEGS